MSVESVVSWHLNAYWTHHYWVATNGSIRRGQRVVWRVERKQGHKYQWVIPELRRTLSLLAAPSQDQIGYIHGNRVHWDELALEFYDVYVLVPQLEAEQCVTHEQAQALTVVDRQLDLMSGQANASLWTDEALRSAPEWYAVRNLAGAALVLFQKDNRSD